MHSLVRRLLATIRRKKAERDLDAEVRFHLQSLADEFEAKGAPCGPVGGQAPAA
jgi:hypothetical protein